jgi:hypothetical protein
VTSDLDAVPAALVEFHQPMTDAEFERFREAFLATVRAGRPSVLAASVQVSRRLPLSRWQAYKHRHAGTWWLDWWVRRWPVSRREVPAPIRRLTP